MDCHRKATEALLQDINKFEFKFEVVDNLKSLVKNNEDLVNSSKFLLLKIEREVIDAQNVFCKQYSSKYNEYVSELKQISMTAMEAKQKLEKTKSSYFDSCKAIHEQEKTIYKLSDQVIALEKEWMNFNTNTQIALDNSNSKDSNNSNKENNTNSCNNQKEIDKESKAQIKLLKEKTSKENELQSASKMIVKLRQGSDELDLLYKQELEKVNNILKDLEPKYQRVKVKIQDLEEGKNIQLSSSLSLFISINSEIFNLGVDNCALNLKISSEISSQSAVKSIRSVHKNFIIKQTNSLSNIFKNEADINHNKYKNQRFPEEEYFNYDVFKRNFETIKLYYESYIANLESKKNELNNQKSNDSSASNINNINNMINNASSTKDFALLDFYGNYSAFSNLKNNNSENGSTVFDDEIPVDYTKIVLNQSDKIDTIDLLFNSDQTYEVERLMKLMDILHSESENRLILKKNNSSNKSKNTNNDSNAFYAKYDFTNKTCYKFIDVIIAQLLSYKSYKVNNYQNFHHLNNLINNIINNEKSCYRIFEILKIACLIHYDLGDKPSSVSLQSVIYLTKGVAAKNKNIIEPIRSESDKLNKGVLVDKEDRSPQVTLLEFKENKEIIDPENNSVYPNYDEFKSTRSYLSILLKNNKKLRDKKSIPNFLMKVVNSKLSLSIKELIDNQKIDTYYFENFKQTTFKSIFKINNSSQKDNKQMEESIKLGKFVEERRQDETFLVLKDFVKIICFYDFDVSEAYTIVSDICKKEVLDNSKLNYLITCLNSYLYSVKIPKNEFLDEKKFYEEKNLKKNYFEKSVNQILSNIASSFQLQKSLKDKDNKETGLSSLKSFTRDSIVFASILSSVKYLTKKEYGNVCLINKYLSENLRRKRFKIALKYGNSDYNSVVKSSEKYKPLENKKRVKIWKYIISSKVSKDELIIKKQYLPPKPRINRMISEVEIPDSKYSNKSLKSRVLDISDKSEEETAMKSSSTKNVKESLNKNINESKDKEISKIADKSTNIKETVEVAKKKENLIYITEDYFSKGYQQDLSNRTYKEKLKIVNDDAALHSIYDIINLDVLRTFYNLSNAEELRKKLFNILKLISYVTRVSYCQGMNYVGSLLLYLTENKEEEAFNLFYLLVQGTEYKLLFEDELFVLKKYFFIYERLTELLIPEVSYAFRMNSIQVSFFSSSWFITIFTSIIINENTVPKILYHIWDDFLLHGWRTVLKVGVCLLKAHEKKLINMKYEELLQFLLNEIYNCWFFKDEFIEDAICLFSSVLVKKGLIQNLELEYKFKKDINEDHI